ncbi:MAG: molybdopterin oxidoreductase family protein [Hyalangium sp.]|uniref:molybdopterin oxidoreductase family protein n=1 Tax=Hyalangium sp. TaxID=2028555 RepID=UPI00389A1A3F
MDETKTLCTFCGVVDQVTVLKDGKVRGSGTLGTCVKGATFFREHFDSTPREVKRFTSPLIRTPYGWEMISWDYAIDMIADTILADRQEFGRDALAFYGVGQMTLEALWVTKKFFQGHLGTNNICSNAEQCLSNNAGGHELVFGNEGPFSCYEDYLHAEAIFIYGHNPAINHPTVFQKYLRRNRKAIKVVVDPRRTNTVELLLADNPENIHLPIKSGSDVLLNCAIARALIDQAAHNGGYVSKYLEAGNSAAFIDFLRRGPFTLEQVLPQITPPELSHEEMGRRISRVVDLWRTRKVVTTSSVGINQTTGSSGVASILNLNLLTGNIGQPGRGHVRLAGQSNASGELALGYSGRLLPFRMRVAEKAHREKMAQIWGVPGWKLSEVPGLPVASFATSPRLRTLFVFGTNPARNFPNLARWREKLADVCLIYADAYYNPEILEYADIILPVRTKHESSGIFLNGERRLQYLQKVEEPPFEAWGDVRIVCSVARRIAERLEENTAVSPDASLGQTQVDELVRQGNLDLFKHSLDQAFAFPVDETGEPRNEAVWNEILRASKGFYNEFIDSEGQPITFDRIRAGEGVQWAGSRRYVPEEGGDGAVFPGVFRAELHKAVFHIPPPERLIPFNERDAESFTLITGRGGMGKGTYANNVAMFNSSTATGQDRWPDENSVYMSVLDAQKLGLKTGERIRLYNTIGEIECRVEVSSDMPSRHLYLTFHPDKRGTHPNFLTNSELIDPQTWQPLLKDTQVNIKLPRRQERA